MDELGTFPFGEPISAVAQDDRRPKRLFVLGVYASAVHARWIGPDSRTLISALAVASEPGIFWPGEGAHEIVRRIQVPGGAGRLEPASPHLNGPSGKALDEQFLEPLHLTREDAWLCDLVPHSCMNPRQEAALDREYRPRMASLGLPEPRWPRVPSVVADERRRAEIADELAEASPDVLITLGDQPLRWFAKHLGTKARLSDYGETTDTYGRLHPVRFDGRTISLLPLVHPRQAAKLGFHSSAWSELHQAWVSGVAPELL